MSLRKLRGAANSDAVVERTTAVTPQQSHRSRPASQQVEPRPGAVLLADLGELLGPPVMPAADPQAAAEIWNLEDDRLGVQRAVAGAADDVLLRHRYPHGPYSMLGPVEVAGAEPGDVIEVSITALRTIRWAWNSFPLGVGALPHDFAEPYLHYFTFDDARTTADFAHGITLPMAPFLGVVAAEPAGDAPVSAIVSGGYGGNLVLRDLGVGSHLFLPVARPGGRVWIGDVHALQGDGVVDQTAIETAAEDLDIRYDLHQQVPLRGPLGETDQGWIVIGFAGSLDDALVACLRELIGWLSAAAGLTGPEAYALASMAVSFRVTQYANQTGSAYTSVPPRAVHAVIPKSVFPADIRDRAARWLRP